MKILLATGIYPPQIGGPAQYAKNLAENFTASGNQTRVIFYGWEKHLPIFIRHFVFFLRLLLPALRSDVILALDTLSVGLPAACMAFIFRKKLVIRIGGDFLWESYVERTGDLIPLSRFYETLPKLSFKERLIFKLVFWTLGQASELVFTTLWQRQIWQKPYSLVRVGKIAMVENYIGQKLELTRPDVPDALGVNKNKVYLFAARSLKLKNLANLKQAFALAKKERPEIELKVLPPVSHDELLKQIVGSYAVLIPSISEVSPNLAWDAIRCNKPFILTKECGYAERLKNEALFVDPLNINNLKEIILELADDNIYRQKVERIMVWQEARSWQVVAQDFLNIFSNL